MIKGFWLVPVGIVLNVALILLLVNAATDNRLPGGTESWLMIGVAELPLLIFMVLNRNHKK